MKEIVRYRGCFVCGEENTIGLKARFFYDGEKAISEITADEAYEGYKNIYHGGILATMLDEVMIKAILAEDIFAVTAEMTIKFKRPVKRGEKIRFEGRVIDHKGRLYLTEGRAVDDKGEPYAEATGKYLEARPELKDRLKESID